MLLRLIRTLFRRRKNPATLNALALDHYERRELDKAEHYFRAIALETPSDVTAWTNLAVSLIAQLKHAAAVPVLMKVVDMQPDLAEAHLDLGVCYNRLRQNADAISHYKKAIALKPDLHKAHANLVNAHLDCCDWNAVDRWSADFRRYKSRQPGRLWSQRIEPFSALTLFPGKTCKEVAIYRAKAIAHSIKGQVGAHVSHRGPYAHEKIRVGYVSADFHDHATAHLTFGLYGAHDRGAFEVFAYSMGPADGSSYRMHIEQTCDHFVDVRFETAERTAERIRADEIDILVDMKGYTANGRPQIFAFRPAPVQVSYLGYPGTTGAEFVDYFISDHIATPTGYEGEFTEKVVRLPGSYQVNDGRQEISDHAFVRADFGLPEDAFVFCSFNRLGKIDRTIFSAWMEILRRVPSAVLWLIREDPQAEVNLRREARSRNIDPERLIFSEKVSKAEHLARHRLADLFLDTYIYNAHTGASDALWAGLPVVTCPGKTFASRVAASLLCAAEIPELIAADLAQYESMAVRLAGNPKMLREIHGKLAQSRATCALFDTPRFVRHLEAAYRRMHEICARGGAVQSFSVSAEVAKSPPA